MLLWTFVVNSLTTFVTCLALTSEAKWEYAAYGLRIHKKSSREGKDQNYMITAEEVVNSAIPDSVSCQAAEGKWGKMEQGKKLKHETRMSQIENDSDKWKLKQ